jgi:hypothetical protein
VSTLLLRVHSRFLRCVLANIPYLACLTVVVWLFADIPDDAYDILRWLIPASAVIGIGMDYFVYRTPAKEAAREATHAARREAHRPNIRL